ncbi:MAG: MarR family EPS-associated transcriptional regulator [Candidatus Omnitrophota bacterium]|nr:MarR family EPS-associated transcriptional regulator [Candidatus Omnitrophota bacterium]
MKPDILNHEKILSVIKELEQNPIITQRDLALKLKISLGKINYFLNALIDKGIIEAKNFKNAKNKLSYMYMLTPEGIRIKFQLIQQFLDWKTREYERLEVEMETYRSMLLAYQNAEVLPKLSNVDATY